MVGTLVRMCVCVEKEGRVGHSWHMGVKLPLSVEEDPPLL